MPPVSPAASRPAVQPGRSSMPQDMFSEVDQAVPAGGVLRPAPPKPAVFQPRTSPQSSSPAAINSPAPAVGGASDLEPPISQFNFKKLLVLGGLVLVLAAIFGGGYWGYKKYTSTDSGEINPIPAPEEKKEIDQGAAVVPPIENPVPAEAIANPEPVDPEENNNPATGTPAVVIPKDSDDDGLSDEEEAGLGTNPNAPDSDNDVLFDREEVKVYGTDPLKADTDGDGYSDGVEVKGGFNPLGTGKLFDPANPAANKK